MRIVASACLVLAILFMVGCGLTDQQKTDLGKVSAIEQKANAAATSADLMKATGRLDNIEKFLNDKTATGLKKSLADFLNPAPDTGKKAAGGGKATPAPTPTPTPTKGTGKTKGAGKTK
jgi:hypothetical protein